MIIQKGFILILTIMMLASCDSVREVKDIKFKNGGVEHVNILKWREDGIKVSKVVNKVAGKADFYYYAEIEYVDDDLMKNLKWKIPEVFLPPENMSETDDIWPKHL